MGIVRFLVIPGTVPSRVIRVIPPHQVTLVIRQGLDTRDIADSAGTADIPGCQAIAGTAVPGYLDIRGIQD